MYYICIFVNQFIPLNNQPLQKLIYPGLQPIIIQ